MIAIWVSLIGTFNQIGLGTDSILINASNITALEQTGAGNRARVDGGGGVDTLKLDGAYWHHYEYRHHK
jgi:hypothetical protein